MFEPDDLPKKITSFQIGQKLDEMSVSDLDETIGILQNEIERLSAAKKLKSEHLNAAAALFGSKS